MGNIIQLGATYAEVELKKRQKTDVAESGELATITAFESKRVDDPLLVDERTVQRKVVMQDLPARVLVDGDWLSIDLIDMSEKGFSFEVDRIMGALFRPSMRLVFALRIPELREFTLFGRIQWTKLDQNTRQVRCGVEIIEVHGPGGGIDIKELLKLLLSYHIRSTGALPSPTTKTAA